MISRPKYLIAESNLYQKRPGLQSLLIRAMFRETVHICLFSCLGLPLSLRAAI